MSIFNNENDSISDDTLLDYIENRLSPNEKDKVEKAIKSSKEVFLSYVAIKEALFLDRLGNVADVSKQNTILKAILPQQHNINHIQFIVRYLAEKVIITSSDQSEIDYRSVMTDFAYRGSEPGPISISRKLDGRDITLVLSPGESKDDYLLNVQIKPASKIDCELFVNGVLIETLKDLSKNSFFSSPLTTVDSSELKFIEKGKVLFTFGIFLKSE